MKKLIPITIISGFLGSGKTSFLNRILKENVDRKIAIILNEFGDVKLESKFVKEKNEGIIELENGCICCVSRGDIISTLKEILRNYPSTDYIIIEASGLSEPFSIFLTFYNPSLSKIFSPDSIICIVDAKNFEKNFDEFDITRKQVEEANFIVITKSEGQNNINQIIELVYSINKKCKVFILDELKNVDQLLETGSTDLRNISSLKKDLNVYHSNFENLLLRSIFKIDFNKFNSFVDNFDRNIIRAKGFIDFKNAPHKKQYLLQYVQGRKDYFIDEEIVEGTVILIIGSKINKKEIKKRFQECEIR